MSRLFKVSCLHRNMYTLLYVFTILSFTRYITTSQAIGLEALTPCFLTASDGVAVQAFCEETITPCTLRASDGALVQAYCEPSLVSEPFASITGTTALQNLSSKTSLLQILARSPDTVSWPDLDWESVILNIHRYPSRVRKRRLHRVEFLPAPLSYLQRPQCHLQ